MKIASSASLGGPIVGGLLIGSSTTLFLLLAGRLTGLSGILEDAVIVKKDSSTDSKWWTVIYTGGLVACGAVLRSQHPQVFISDGGNISTVTLKPTILIISGLLTGFGTRLGCGCTSGHGISGLSRLSPRSLVAVLTFMLTGAISATISRHPTYGSHFYEPARASFFASSAYQQFFPTLVAAAAVSAITYIRGGVPSKIDFSAVRLKDCLASFLCASIFGVGLGISGMLQKSKVLGFLNFTGKSGWDYSLMGVMGGGVLLNLITFYCFRHFNVQTWIPPIKNLRNVLKYGLDPANMKIDGPLVLGAALFGVGWGISGFCPGPTLVSLGGRVREASIYVPAMLVGMLAQDFFKTSSAPSAAKSASDTKKA
jgi:uncharacterized membrane protein YedE/YeeE